MFIPNRFHDMVLKRLSQKLKNTQDRGLVFDPNYDIFNVDAYPDVEFAGTYEKKIHDDPACAKSCTGFINTFVHCPVL